MDVLKNFKPLSKVLSLFLFCLVGLFLAGSVIVIITALAGEEWMLSAWGIRVSSGIQAILVFLLPAITLLMWRGYSPYGYLKLNRFETNSSSLYLLAVVILLVGMPFISLLTQANQMMKLPEFMSGFELWMKELEDSALATTNLLLEGNSVWDLLGNLLFIAVFAAIAEEVFFRGALQQLVGELFKSVHTSVWLTAFIFSLMHMQFYGFVPRLVLGAILGYLFAFSGNLWIPIVAHFFNNAMVVVLSFLFSESSVYQELENPPFSVLFIALGAVSMGLLVYFMKIYSAKSIAEREDKLNYD